MRGTYEIVNLHDGKATAYVGSSVDIKKRRQAKKRGYEMKGANINDEGK